MVINIFHFLLSRIDFGNLVYVILESFSFLDISKKNKVNK
jgi:hypothetical protein